MTEDDLADQGANNKHVQVGLWGVWVSVQVELGCGLACGWAKEDDLADQGANNKHMQVGLGA